MLRCCCEAEDESPPSQVGCTSILYHFVMYVVLLLKALSNRLTSIGRFWETQSLGGKTQDLMNSNWPFWWLQELLQTSRFFCISVGCFLAFNHPTSRSPNLEAHTKFGCLLNRRERNTSERFSQCFCETSKLTHGCVSVSSFQRLGDTMFFLRCGCTKLLCVIGNPAPGSSFWWAFTATLCTRHQDQTWSSHDFPPFANRIQPGYKDL